MAFLVRHVETHPRTGRLSYRRVYPTELRPFIPGNRRELKVSLGEKALTDGQALRIFNQASARYDAEVALARKVATQAFDPLDPSSVQYLANTYLARELMVDERGAWGEVPERGYPRRADLEGDYCEC